MGRVERVTVASLIEEYSRLAPPERNTFLALLGECSSADDARIFLVGLDEQEQTRLLSFISRITIQPDAPELEPLLNELVAAVRVILEREVAEYKTKRDRKSNPETIKRNVEICDLRKQDRRKWSLVKLAKRYEVSARAITLVLQEESKWRELASALGSE